jgi:hypothetical protein
MSVEPRKFQLVGGWLAMSNLDFYIHDGSNALRLKIIGDLTGPGVASLGQAWRTASPTLRGRWLIIDLVSLSDADEDGRELLLRWHQVGAKIVARSQESRALAEKIIGVPIQMLAPKRGWREKLSEHFLRRTTPAASKPALSATTGLNLSALNQIGRRFPDVIVGEADPCDQA